MSRILAISVALGPLLVLPALCMGGIIAHECACDTGPSHPAEPLCRSDHNCGHHPGHGHERGCAEDPCNITAVRPVRGVGVVLDAPQPATWAQTGRGGDEPPVAVSTVAGANPRLGYKNLPFPLSDLPLLV